MTNPAYGDLPVRARNRTIREAMVAWCRASRGRQETTMAKKPKNPAAERAAAAIMREFSPKTADEAQEAL